jgi:Tfp pilus assembly protein PilF
MSVAPSPASAAILPARRSGVLAPRRWEAVYGLLLVVAAAGPFATVWTKQFTNWDDAGNIVENGAVRWLTATNAAYLFTHAIGGNYIPLTWLSHALDWQIFGADAWSHGLMNAFWHAVCCFLVVACLRRGGMDASPVWLTGLLFAVHPVHAENVAWISGRKDLLCAAALLACQYAYMGWRIESRLSSWLWSLFWLVVAGLCKPTAMSAVACLALYDVMWLGRPLRDAGRALVPHAVICAAIALVAIPSQNSGSAIAAATDQRWGALDLAGCNLLLELWRCWLPVPFSPFLPNSILEDLPAWSRWLGTAALAGSSIAVFMTSTGRRPDRLRWTPFAWWWFGSLAFLLPVCGLIPLGHTSLADRYLYLPSFGPCVFIALGLSSLARRVPRTSVIAAGAILMALAWVVHERAAAWADSYSLWRTTLARFPHCGLAWQNLTRAYYQDDRIQDAAEIALEGVQAAPNDLATGINAAVLLTDLGRFSDADTVLSAAAAIHPEAAEILNQRGLLALRRARPAEARGWFQSAASQRPRWEQPYLNLTYAFEQEHDLPAALDAAQEAVRLSPMDSESRRRLVDLLFESRQTDEALAALAEITRAFPHDADAWRNRIVLLRQAGRNAEADQLTRQAGQYLPPESLR